MGPAWRLEAQKDANGDARAEPAPIRTPINREPQERSETAEAQTMRHYIARRLHQSHWPESQHHNLPCRSISISILFETGAAHFLASLASGMKLATFNNGLWAAAVMVLGRWCAQCIGIATGQPLRGLAQLQVRQGHESEEPHGAMPRRQVDNKASFDTEGWAFGGREPHRCDHFGRMIHSPTKLGKRERAVTTVKGDDRHFDQVAFWPRAVLVSSSPQIVAFVEPVFRVIGRRRRNRVPWHRSRSAFWKEAAREEQMAAETTVQSIVTPIFFFSSFGRTLLLLSRLPVGHRRKSTANIVAVWLCSFCVLFVFLRKRKYQIRPSSDHSTTRGVMITPFPSFR
ncbi:hypothetical protein NM208_g14192 [Fusarium decemcellulare]|uniref:Uncharacterized protein n=1 Tax=Fusarium decemcellulare TaxID=57161 RepID=A0ACC1RL56_9HYPO|nr:hypothetical protein NM208_g14192 [Fusarium decemcellulare]